MGYGKFKGVLWCNIGTSDKTYTYAQIAATLRRMREQYHWSYLVYGDEVCPTTGRCHMDFYYEMPDSRKIKTELKKFNKFFGQGFYSLYIARGSAGENFDYSSKDGSWAQHGEPAKDGQRHDLKEACAEISAGRLTSETIVSNNPELYHTYGRTLEKVEDLYLRQQHRTEAPWVTWIYGPTDAGKSHFALKDFTPSTHYIWRNDNGWQDAYRQQQTVVINDFRGEIPYNELLQLLDKWPYYVKRRHREPMPFTSNRIIITSSLHPASVYNRRLVEDNIAQLLRRIELKRMEARDPKKRCVCDDDPGSCVYCFGDPLADQFGSEV